MTRRAGRFVGRLAALALAALAALTALTVSGCGIDIPADPDGTLDRVSGGVLRVGVSTHEPWVETPSPAADDAEPTGIEPDLVREFASTIDADIRWSRGGEESLVHRMERGELDLVIGGLTAKSPWAELAVLTRPYTSVPGPEGKPEQHVMAAPMGENAFLVELERFLLASDLRR